MNEKINKPTKSVNSQRRSLNKAIAWSIPTVSAVSLPMHAQATPQVCTFPATSSWIISSITTDDIQSFATPTPATYIPNANFGDTNRVDITISGTDVIVDIQGAFARTFPAQAFSIRGRNVCEGTIDLDTGVVTVTTIGPREAHPQASLSPHYYSPEGGFSFNFPCGATSLNVSYAASNQFFTGFSNSYVWDLIP